MSEPSERNSKGIGLALSGGGSRAIAFHLGCFRALEERRMLDKIRVISAVSGGSIFAAMYAYNNDNFTIFTQRIEELLQHGLHWAIAQQLFSPVLFTKIIATNFISLPVAAIARIFGQQPPLRRWASRTDALEQALHSFFGDIKVEQVSRPNLDIVLNACELRTGTAFRFGNLRSGGYRFGEIKDNDISVAHAVASSAAYPIFLPAFDQILPFTKEGISQQKRVIITDGGIYDNLGISCLEPGRNENFNLHSYSVDYIICCYAGHGQFSGHNIPYGFISRTEAVFQSVFRRVQDAALHRLHIYQQQGMIKGFVLPYLGQQDAALPSLPPDLIRREEVLDYPTNFAAMSMRDINLIAKRGQQLTRLLMERYWHEL